MYQEKNKLSDEYLANYGYYFKKRKLNYTSKFVPGESLFFLISDIFTTES